jgi:hypothetical protein
MNAKLRVTLLSLLLLSGCATIDPIDAPDTASMPDAAAQEATNKPADRRVSARPTVTSTKLEAKRGNAAAASSEPDMLTLSRLLVRLDLVATLEPESIKKRIQQLEARFKELNPADRYEFALLLSHKGANTKSLNRAISILDELREDVKDKVVLKILMLQRRHCVLKKQYRLERFKTNELEKKIERLKGLEQYLDKSNSRMHESSNPAPGDAQQQ